MKRYLIAVILLFVYALLLSGCETFELVAKVKNETSVPIVVVLTRDNPNPYWTNYSDALQFGVPIASGEIYEECPFGTRKNIMLEYPSCKFWFMTHPMKVSTQRNCFIKRAKPGVKWFAITMW
ncbi:MAG: hypothetical protein NC127_04500 [Muribaculum sp.]|nr:hypothetical protein [Muribaculum sp.]